MRFTGTACLVLALLGATAAAAALEVHFPNDRPRRVDSPLDKSQVNVEEFEKLASRLRHSSNARFYCEGHTSKPGTVSYNKALAEKRCSYVVHHLKARGIDRAVEPLARDVLPGCHGSGVSVVCGEQHASENHAESRRIVARFVTAWKPRTCEVYNCPRPLRRKPSTTSCTSGADCKAKCCEWDPAQGCASVKCPDGGVKVEGTVPCDSTEDCVSKCCQYTCDSFWAHFPCPSPLKKKTGDAKGLEQCNDVKGCLKDCCAATTCGTYRALHPCEGVEPWQRSAPDRTECDGESSCEFKCCPLKVVIPPRRDDGPTIRNPPKPRDCEKDIQCLGQCLYNQCGPAVISLAPTKGKAICRERCANACQGRTIRGCIGDAHLRMIKVDNCRSMCR